MSPQANLFGTEKPQASPTPGEVKPLRHLALGKMCITRGIAIDCENVEGFRYFVQQCLARHSRGEWGDLESGDKALNDQALKSGQDRILSSYEHPNFPKIWIITEWDRSVTTVLFPSEY